MFYCSALWQFFCVVAYNAEHLSALLPTTQKNVPRCCLQHQSFFRVVGNNAESAPISVYVCFSALLPTTQIIFPRCRPQHGKIICVVAYNVEKWSALLATTQKNVWIWLSPRIRNHIRIYTRVSIRGLSWCVSWRKVEVKNLVGRSL